MSLLAYNLTILPLALPGVAPPTSLPASLSAGSRGPAFNVTGELKPLTAIQFAALQLQVAAGSVQYEWSALPEFNTFSLVVGSAQTDVADVDIAIFVSPSGLDTNPGTSGAPFLTFERALKALPSAWRKSCTIFLSAGSFPYDSGQTGTNFPYGPSGPEATPLAIIGTFTDIDTLTTDSYFDSLSANIDAVVTTIPLATVAGLPSSGTVYLPVTDEFMVYTSLQVAPPALLGVTRGAFPTFSSGASPALSGQPVIFIPANIVASSGTPFATAQVGQILECTAGNNEGSSRMIRDVISPTEVTVTTLWDAPPGAGDSFTLKKPGSVLSLQRAQNVFAGACGVVGFRGVKISLDVGGSDAFTAFINGFNPAFWGSEIALNGRSLLFAASELRSSFGITATAWDGQGVNNPFTFLDSTGVYMHDGSISFLQYARFVGDAGVIKDAQVQFETAHCDGPNIDFQNTLVSAIQGSMFVVVTDRGPGGVVNRLGGPSFYPAGGALEVKAGGQAQVFYYDVLNSVGNGVIVQGPGSAAELWGVTGTPANIGGVGLWVYQGATATINDNTGARANTTVAGASGEVLIGGRVVGAVVAGGLPETYAALVAATDAEGNVGAVGLAGDRVAVTSFFNNF